MSTITLRARRLVARAIRPKTIATLAVAFFATTTAACSSNDGPSGPSRGAIVGSYSLQSVDGRGLPAMIFDDNVRLDDDRIVRLKVAVTGGSLDLEHNEEFSGRLTLTLTVEGQAQNESLPIGGEYTRAGNTISFESNDPDGPSFKGTIRDGSLELEMDIFDIGEATTYTFKK